MSGPRPEANEARVRIGDSELVLRDLVARDADAVVALHTQVFGKDVDATWFAWKYGDNRHEGCGEGMTAWHDGTLVAFCGGLPRSLWHQGQRLGGLQIGDVMVHPEWRGILTRRGPFFQVSQALYASRIGVATVRPFQLGFGFPNLRHLRLGVILDLLWDGGQIEELKWSTATATPTVLPWGWRWRALLPTEERFDRVVDSAWESMRKESPDLMLGERNAAYLRWRYVDRPPSVDAASDRAPRYRFFELLRPWWSAGSGVAVLDLRSATARWLDWVGPLELMPHASLACRAESAMAGATELSLWASQAVADVLAKAQIDHRVVCAGLGIPVIADMSPPKMPVLDWWLMGGDTDFL